MDAREEIAGRLYPRRWFLLSLFIIPSLSLGAASYLGGSVFGLDGLLEAPRLARPLVGLAMIGAVGFAWAMLFTPPELRTNASVSTGAIVRIALLTTCVAGGLVFIATLYASATAAG